MCMHEIYTVGFVKVNVYLRQYQCINSTVAGPKASVLVIPNPATRYIFEPILSQFFPLLLTLVFMLTLPSCQLLKCNFSRRFPSWSCIWIHVSILIIVCVGLALKNKSCTCPLALLSFGGVLPDCCQLISVVECSSRIRLGVQEYWGRL